MFFFLHICLYTEVTENPFTSRSVVLSVGGEEVLPPTAPQSGDVWEYLVTFPIVISGGGELVTGI